MEHLNWHTDKDGNKYLIGETDPEELFNVPKFATSHAERVLPVDFQYYSPRPIDPSFIELIMEKGLV